MIRDSSATPRLERASEVPHAEHRPNLPIPEFFFSRLKAARVRSTVRGSLPVLFFGDLFSASVVTIGINPSRQEYLSAAGKELEGGARRFETLRSLRAKNRAALTVNKMEIAINRMRGYFDYGKPIYPWFNGLSRVMEGMGFSFADGSAAHLDLVQEATDPVWSGLLQADREQAYSVLRRDLPFLRQQLESFEVVIIYTSARVLQELRAIFPIEETGKGKLARITWSVGVAKMRRGPVAIAGWNIPLARATGLDRSGQKQLGALLSAQIRKLGLLAPR